MDYLTTVLPAIKRFDAALYRAETAARKAARDSEDLPESRFRYQVKVITEEGEIFIYENAYAFWLDDWYCVVAEHHAPVAYHRDETLWCGMYKRMITPVHTLDGIDALAQEHGL